MVGGSASVRSVGVLVCLVSVAVSMALPLRATIPDELAEWAGGPVQWLLLPDERKDLKRVQEADEVAAFIEAFWLRRDRDPIRTGNEYHEKFLERVEAADILYGDEGARGSLTDRGRALILMGPPAHVTVSTEPVMAWDPASRQGDRVTMRDVNVEIWGYRMEDLPQGMVELMMSRQRKSDGDSFALTLTFRRVGRRTTLVDGDELLEIAAQAAVTGAGHP
jgi:GWxTD domain-containing protein